MIAIHIHGFSQLNISMYIYLHMYGYSEFYYGVLVRELYSENNKKIYTTQFSVIITEKHEAIF